MRASPGCSAVHARSQHCCHRLKLESRSSLPQVVLDPPAEGGKLPGAPARLAPLPGDRPWHLLEAGTGARREYHAVYNIHPSVARYLTFFSRTGEHTQKHQDAHLVPRLAAFDQISNSP